MTSKYHRVSITIEKELWDKTLAKAKAQGISASALIRMLILKDQPKKR